MANTKIQLDRIDTSNQHTVQAYVGALVFATSVNTTVTNYTSVVDDNNSFNATTGVWTCPEDGAYLFIVQVRWQDLTINKRYQVSWETLSECIMSQTTNWSTQNGSLVSQKTAGDTKTCVIWHNAGTNRTAQSVKVSVTKLA